MTIVLTEDEIAVLDRQDQRTAGDGGFQGLLVRLQRKLNRTTLAIELDAKDLEEIPRYAFDYKNGGWQTRLVSIFGRTLSSNLGR